MSTGGSFIAARGSLSKPMAIALRLYVAVRVTLDDPQTPVTKRESMIDERDAAAFDLVALAALPKHRDRLALQPKHLERLNEWAAAPNRHVRNALAVLLAEAMLAEYGPSMGIQLR